MSYLKIDLEGATTRQRHRASELGTAPEVLADILATELVREAQGRAPLALRQNIRSRRSGKGRIVETTDDRALPYLTEAMDALDRRRIMRRLVKQLDL